MKRPPESSSSIGKRSRDRRVRVDGSAGAEGEVEHRLGLHTVTTDLDATGYPQMFSLL